MNASQTLIAFVTSASGFISLMMSSFLSFPCCESSSLISKSLNEEQDEPFEADASLSLPLSSVVDVNRLRIYSILYQKGVVEL